MRTLVRRRIETDAERLAWLIVIATIPVGILGLAFEHQFRVLFAKPLAAACFLTVNGLILLAGEAFRRRNVRLAAAAGVPAAESPPGLRPRRLVPAAQAARDAGRAFATTRSCPWTPPPSTNWPGSAG